MKKISFLLAAWVLIAGGIAQAQQNIGCSWNIASCFNMAHVNS
jgi:hypothetical protein